MMYKATIGVPVNPKIYHIVHKDRLASVIADGVDDPKKPLEIVPGAVDDASKFLSEHTDTRERFQQGGQGS